jgi:biotin transport system substrate-specific component
MNASTASAYTLIKPSSRWLEIPLLASFNLLLVGCAYIAIHLPFSPVPVTGQTFGVLLVAMALGRVRGTAVVMAYLLEGACGLPVFAGGSGGAMVLFGPTGGYLLGFVAAAWLVGYLADRGWDRNLFKSLTAMTAGTVIIFLAGLAWLAQFVGTGAVLAMGLVPFIPGAIIKLSLASVILPSVWRFVGRK